MIKLLIADDERIIRETISNLIDWNSLGVELVGLAQNGFDAYNLILDECPDIVLTDIRMPGISGLELIHKISEMNQHTKFIILSGYSDFEYAKTAMKYGVRHYILKPCNEEQIIQSIKEIKIELLKEKAFNKVEEEQQQLLTNMYNNYLLNIINDSLAEDYSNTDFVHPSIIEKYSKYLDFFLTPHEVFFIDSVKIDKLKEVLEHLEILRTMFSPSIHFSYLYIQNTLIFFFISYTNNYEEVESFLHNIFLSKPTEEITIEHFSHNNLNNVLKQVLTSISRYETIYYSDGNSITTISNYKNIITEMNSSTIKLFEENKKQADVIYNSILKTLSMVTDVDLLKQLTSSIIIHSTSKSILYNPVSATEFLIKIGTCISCNEIREHLFTELNMIYNEYHSSDIKGELSTKIREYVEEHLQYTGLSLKWIAENLLYMNQDYVSKKFMKETGQKFSHYLTSVRIKRAKELLATVNPDKIQYVAEMVGCGNNPQYFSLLFKKNTGYTPSAYIKMMQSTSDNTLVLE